MRGLVLALIASLAVAGCGPTSSSSSGSPTSGTAGAAGGVQTAVTQSVMLSSAVDDQQSTANSYKAGSPSLEDTLLTQLSGVIATGRQYGSGLPMQKTTTVSCTSGNMVVTTDAVGTNPYHVDIVYTNCVNGSATTNGSVSVVFTRSTTDNSATFTITMGNGDTTADASDLTITSGNLLTTFSITASGSVDTTGLQKAISLSGIARIDNTGGSDFVQFVVNGFSASSVVNSTVTTTTLSGGLAFSAQILGVSASSQATLSNFVHTRDSSDYSSTISGTLTLSSTPATCTNGTYTVATVTPLIYDSTWTTIQTGKITLNNATVEYLSGGSVLITLSGGSTRSYTLGQLTNPYVCKL